LGNYREAADMFRRVLSSDPENFPARARLGELFAEEESLDEALWQTERAFELNPGDADVRNRLRELHTKRHGTQPDRLKLNGVALGRLYARGGWHDLAIQEFLSLLDKDPARVDVRIALAEALWIAGRRQEAAIISEELLAELPNCLKANLILGQIWTESGLDEGWDRLQLAQDLDPENRVAQQMFGPESPLPLQEATIPPVGTAPPVVMEEVPETEPERLPAWLQSLSEEEQEISPPVPLSSVQPDVSEGLWVVDLRAATDQAIAARPRPEPETPSPVDWVAELREVTEQALQSCLARRVPAPTPPAWLTDLRMETDLALAQRLDAISTPHEAPPRWIDDLRLHTADLLEQQRQGEPVSSPEEPTVSPAAATADWVTALQRDTDTAMTSVRRETDSWIIALREETSKAMASWPATTSEPEPVGPETFDSGVVQTTPSPEVQVEEATAEPEPTAAQSPEEVTDDATPPSAQVAEEPQAERIAELYQKLDMDPNNHALCLELASTCQQAGNRDDALLQFTRLVREAKELAPQVVEALESWAQQVPDDLEVQQLLGDAYASADNLSEALAQYRRVLEMTRRTQH